MIVGVFVAVIVVVQQALVARSPSGYQVAILHVARQIGLAPPQPTFGDPSEARGYAYGYGYGFGFGFAGRPGTGTQLNAAARAIGISVAQLRTELATSSLAQVAHEHGVDASDVAAAMKASSDAQVDAAVSSGRLAAGEAAERKAQADERIDRLMTQR